MTNFTKSKIAKAGLCLVVAAFMFVGGTSAMALTQTDADALCVILSCTTAQKTAVQALVTGGSTTTTTTTTSSYAFNTDLTLGSKGADVTALQQILVSKGYLTMPAGVAMGYFGTLTQSAVSKYQAAAGISPTAGYFGPKTRLAFNAM